MDSFDELFRTATGHEPAEYLRRAARDGLPDVVTAAPEVGAGAGAGKTGLILAWLWRRLSGQHGDATPRRLIYALPTGALAEPTAGAVRRWLANLGLTDDVALHVALAARAESYGEWRENIHRPAIVIGTADVLVSKALLRGYDIGRAIAPIDFALVTNGAHWLVAASDLSPATTATLRQLAALAEVGGTAEPFGLTRLFPERFRVTPPGPSPDAIAVAARERRRPGRLGLVVLDTVEAAQSVYRTLRGDPAACTLLHSRLRGVDRALLLADIAERPEDRIVVTTEAVAVGLDYLSADILVTAAAPTADDSAAEEPAAVLDRAGLSGLFDTAPDVDRDIAPYVRDGADLDAEVAWATWTPGEDGAPDPEVRMPPAERRCLVPLGAIAELARGRAVWRFDTSAGAYARVDAEGQPPVRPHELLLVNAADGGYDPELGFDPGAREFVDGSPVLRTPAELEEIADPETVAEERHWQSLDVHSEQVRDQAAALLRVLRPDVPEDAAKSVIVSGYLHDVGKAHPIWQDALCALAEEDDVEMVASGRPWAKSGGKGGALEFAGGVSFRHELASLLLIDGPLRHLVAEAPDPDLARYGVLAHHGRLRVHVRDDADRADDEPRVIRGLVEGVTTDIPPMLAQPATRLTADLGQFGDGDDTAWTRTVRRLLDRYGPFKLAYLETLVRMADWRASGGSPLP